MGETHLGAYAEKARVKGDWLVALPVGLTARDAMAIVEPYMVTGRYVNEQSDGDEGMAEAIYGGAKYQRLVALKRQWDPDNVFRLNQNIRP